MFIGNIVRPIPIASAWMITAACAVTQSVTDPRITAPKVIHEVKPNAKRSQDSARVARQSEAAAGEVPRSAAQRSQPIACGRRRAGRSVDAARPHSELRVTADLYSHLQKETAAKAARHMDALFIKKEHS